jgi:hypothetical protein
VRDVIIHYHIFKNAGSSIDAALQSSFGTGWASFDLAERWTNITSADLQHHLRSHPEIRALSSHQARWPEPNLADLKAHPIVFLRHPIDRIGSIYAYNRRIGADEARGKSLAEYVDWLLAPAGGIVARSFQTLFLSDDDSLSQDLDRPLSQATAGHFASAVSRLRHLPVFGLVERFEASLILLQKSLSATFPELSLRPARHNVSTGRAASLPDRLADMASSLGRKRYRRLVAVNQADLELWAVAGELFKSMWPG